MFLTKKDIADCLKMVDGLPIEAIGYEMGIKPSGGSAPNQSL